MEKGDVILWCSVALTQLTFLAIPYLINESNAKYYLAGYNTLSKADRKNFDLKGYLVFQKKFLITYSLTTAFIFIVSYFILLPINVVIIYVISLTIPLPYLIIQGNKFKNKNT
ncbi:MAG: hypothetical protein CMB82_10605 [Flammeovirgaceae bacterium]|nr:hypothetical protein [Flammeovirgaceae bacterium]|tara:strand:- start:4660 stop:4998 length:339 start_codon:yes stop_codon:yes gene_type:complete